MMNKIKKMFRIIKWFFSLFNFWKWPLESIEDYKEWSIVRTATKEQKTIEKFYSNNPQLRVDGLGRIYTVINVPEDYSKNKTTSWTYVMGELSKLNEVLISVGISELVYPEIKQETAYSYVIILQPSFDYLNFKSFFKEILRWAFLIIFFKVLNLFLLFHTGINFFHEIYEFLFAFLR